MRDERESRSPPWAPQLGPQADAIAATWCPELLYGGAAGGGKSDFLLGDFLQDVPTYGEAWRGILFRRTYRELEELVARSHEIYPDTGAIWRATKDTWAWPNGAQLRLRYLERDLDATRYQGHAYTWVGFDELTQWPSPFPYRYLRARLRSAHPVPTKRLRASANPGGRGHHWVKREFVDPAPRGYVPFVDPEMQTERMFIPSRLLDNRILMAADPGYANRLKGLGSPELVRAWLDGDWSVVIGSYFPEFSMDDHVIAPRVLPRYWARFRSMDWGSARPFSVGWWAVSDGELADLPRGALVRYREWYGAAAPNVGLKMTAEEVARGILAREKNDLAPGMTMTGVCDPAMFAQDGGPSLAERMAQIGCAWNPADNRRVGQVGALGGWDQLRARLKGDGERPAIYFFDTCRDAIRTLPALQHDELRAEDVDSDGEDHAADEIRYACMSRPYIRETPDQALRDRYTARHRYRGRRDGSYMSA